MSIFFHLDSSLTTKLSNKINILCHFYHIVCKFDMLFSVLAFLGPDKAGIDAAIIYSHEICT